MHGPSSPPPIRLPRYKAFASFPPILQSKTSRRRVDVEKNSSTFDEDQAAECRSGALRCNVDRALNLGQISTVSSVALPPRIDEQSLHGYVRAHLPHLEYALDVGVPYRALANAALAAGFANVPLRTIQNAVYQARKKSGGRASAVVLQAPATRPSLSRSAFAVDPSVSEPKSDSTAIRRRLLDLARPPMPGEPDPLI